MFQQLQTIKQQLDPFLLAYLDEAQSNFAGQELVDEAFAKLKSFVISGKSVRGGLFLLVAESLDQESYAKYHRDLFLVATALELIHSGLLIHDDVIDQDEKRRGQNSIWHQYEQFARDPKQNYKNPKDYGQSLAICLGSIVQYLATLALEKISEIPEKIQKKLKKTISQEIIKTYFAEMLDSKITLQKNQPTYEEVLQMYLFKTARYTFSLPLQLASLASGADQSTNERLTTLLSQIGEKLGLIFQIKDDQISLFATQEVSGKSFASDIREGKKTIFYLTLLAELDKLTELGKPLEAYGKKNLSHQEIIAVQTLFTKFANPKVEKLLEQLAQETQQLIASIASLPTKQLLTATLAFNLQRSF